MDGIHLTGSLIDAGTCPIWVEQRGSGQDLVLFSGLGDTHRAWSSQLDAFSNRYRVTAIDNRGVGKSELPPGSFSIGDMAADAVHVLDSLGIANAHIAGFSLGGAIAQELCLMRPNLSKSLTLVGSWCRTNAYQRQLFESWSWMAETADDDEAFIRAIYLWVYTRRAHIDGSINRWVRDMLAEENPQSTDAFNRTISAILTHDTADRLHLLRLPTLIVAGEDDLVCPPDVQHDLALRLPESRLRIISDEAHQPFQEAPEIFNSIVSEFVSGMH